MTVGRTLHEIILSHGKWGNGEERCIGICSEVKATAEDFLGEIKWHLSENHRFRAIFPDIVWVDPVAGGREFGYEWTKSEIMVRGRKKPRKESTVRAFSLDSLPVGSHFDRIICDDAVTQSNSDTPEMIRLTLRKLELLEPLLITPAYPLDYVGTVYNFGDFHAFHRDLHEYQLKRGVKPTLALFYREAAKFDRETNTLYDPCCPEILPISLLNKIMRDTPEMFWSQYMLRPNIASRNRFDKDDFRFYSQAELNAAGALYKVMFCDPARTISSTSDYTAAAVVGVASNKRIYLLDGFRERLSPDEVAQKLSALNRKWKPDYSVIEQNGLEQWLGPALQLYGFTSYDAQSSTGKKDARIRSLHAFVRKHMIWISADKQYKVAPDGTEYELGDEFMKEALAFPNGGHDDFLDALQGAVRYSGAEVPMSRIEAERPKTGTLQEAFDHFRSRPKEREGGIDPVFGDFAFS
jgi:predicted phage terminase large subunit-like protein